MYSALFLRLDSTNLEMRRSRSACATTVRHLSSGTWGAARPVIAFEKRFMIYPLYKKELFQDGSREKRVSTTGPLQDCPSTFHARLLLAARILSRARGEVTRFQE